MTSDELRNAAILLRRGSWVAPELFEHAADEIERLQANDRRYQWFVANKFERYGNGQEHVLYFPAGHVVGHVDEVIDAAINSAEERT